MPKHGPRIREQWARENPPEWSEGGKWHMGEVFGAGRMGVEEIVAKLDTNAGKREAEKIKAEADRSAQTSIADAYREAEKLRGEGDAKTAEISAKAYGSDQEFYAFYRALNAYRDSFRDQKDVLVMEPDGEFFKYLKQSGDGGGPRR